jgi:HAD superfamily hydrolase (TIGR01490 family)
LDDTLIAGDSDFLWGKFLADIGVRNLTDYVRDNQRFYEEYHNGILDIHEFLEFSLHPLSEYDLPQLLAWRQQFMEQCIDPIILPLAQNLVATHRSNGDTLLIITSTNTFVTAPIAKRFNIEHLLAPKPEWKDGRYTGKVQGVICFQVGKITCLKDWLQTHNESMRGSFFYTDSHNDLPLLELVDNPMAVNPDKILYQYAQNKRWSIIDLRSGQGL